MTFAVSFQSGFTLSVPCPLHPVFCRIVSFPPGTGKIDIMKIAPFSDKIFEQRINHLSTAKDE
jgi:hypothetical protein